jgi:hypothetical protein
METKITIKHRYSGEILFEFECTTILECLSEAIKQKASLHYANLSNADLSFANLRFADLSNADLSNADLSNADLSFANLSYADLSNAATDKRYIQISCIGSRKRMTTYCFEDNKIWCGCFTGTLEEFEASVNKTHKDNAKWLKEYSGFITYLKSLK